MLPGPRKGPCPCGCPLYGTPLRGKIGHVRGCGCRRCGGKRSRRTGLEAQREGARGVGVPRVGSMWPGHEEDYRGALRVESKAGGQVGPIITRFLAAEAQSEAKRPIGDHRPFAMIAAHEKCQVLVFRVSAARDVLSALAENLLPAGEGDVVPEEAEDGAQGTPLVGRSPGLASGPGLSGVVDAVEHAVSVHPAAHGGNDVSVSFPMDLVAGEQYDAVLDTATGRLTLRRIGDV